MLKKTPVKKTNKTSVLFEYEGFPQAEQVCVAGEFNDWEPAGTPMKKRKDGTWTVAMRLPNEGRFEYRFVVDGRVWIVDESADDMVANPFGGRNSVVVMNAPGAGATNGAGTRNGGKARSGSNGAAVMAPGDAEAGGFAAKALQATPPKAVKAVKTVKAVRAVQGEKTEAGAVRNAKGTRSAKPAAAARSNPKGAKKKPAGK